MSRAEPAESVVVRSTSRRVTGASTRGDVDRAAGEPAQAAASGEPFVRRPPVGDELLCKIHRHGVHGGLPGAVVRCSTSVRLRCGP